MKKILFILLCLVCVFVLTGCTKSDAKKGYELVQNEVKKAYFSTGVKKDKVVFEGCEYVMVKQNGEKEFYYRVKYSVHFGNYANDFTEQYRWIKGNNGIDKVSYATYSDMFDNVNNKVVKGSIGSIVNK